ncbi:GEVED domain-containing protein [Wenyingzhuangia aestuarii]|uniref:GEVED domain-containing protein n=1 Tax=Wenyingzhuangia aestuarii TaxID=1647582 RepID=UPI00143C4322|nr:GEVED domain-containing protein [Wenyingzhuangia aestuarii]NJB82368.1 hypothetical protein [Wenyingzhuangia aestuarii]
MKIKYYVSLLTCILLCTLQNIYGQVYTEPINYQGYHQNFISNIELNTLENTSTGTAGSYIYYDQTTTLYKGSSYTGSITYTTQYDNHYVKIWIDYNSDGDFIDSGEEIFSYFAASTNTPTTLAFPFTVPAGAKTGVPRMRVAVSDAKNSPLSPQNFYYGAGETEDYNIDIRPTPTPPTASCVGNLNISLDISGNASITASQINNGSTDDYNSANELSYSLNKTSFNCNDIGSNTVILTVTDTDGLVDTCSTTVNVSAYSGSFSPPTLNTINAYCSYSAVAPTIDYQCGQLITATTTDPINYNSAGNYTIHWNFSNGSTTVTSTQTINVINPSIPTNLTIQNTNETNATINWTTSDTGPFKIRYRPTGDTSWLSTTSSTKSITLTNLFKGTEYEVQVAVNASCASFTESSTFTTLAVLYCDNSSVKISSDNRFYIDQVQIGDINNTTQQGAGTYNYYSNMSTVVTAGSNFSGTVKYKRPHWSNPTTCVIWIDYDQDGVFNNSDERVFSNSNYQNASNGTFSIEETFNNITVPISAVTGKTRMRISMTHNTPANACDFGNEEGEIEDYDIFIKPSITPPTAVCIGTLNINLDVTGSATITPEQINNGSYDDYDASGNLKLLLDKSSFTCNNLGDNIVTLTVTDSDGLTDTCTATVNIAPYAGTFTSPTLDPITSFCSYTATAPVMNYQCGTQITATTTDDTTLTESGSITWNFNNGNTSTNSVQNITILNPTTPTDLIVNNVSEKTATATWNSVDDAPFKIRYKETNSVTWTKVTSTNKSINLTGLNNGSEYEIQVATDADCANFTNSTTFNTIEIEYCDGINTNIAQHNNYFISNTNINSGEINQSTGNNSGPYQYFPGTFATVTAGGTLSATITYQKNNNSTVGFVVYIDYNQDGDFDDNGELIYSNLTNTTGKTIVETLSNIEIPSGASTGKTRIRVAILQGQLPVDACHYNGYGDIEDYDIYINPLNLEPFESAVITQVYHNTSGEKWIEITNNGNNTIPTNTLILALFKDKTGNQTGVAPTETYTLNTSLTSGESVLIKASTSSVNYPSITVLANDNITDFVDGNDIIAIVSQSGTKAWEKRYDVITSIENNSSYVRNDNISTYNKTYTATEWTAFVNDNLDPYRTLANGGPQRHPNAPVLSEVNNANSTSNIKLGVHHFGATSISSGTWTNGTPDKSRSVIINEDYEEDSTPLLARKLNVTGDNTLTVTNQPLIVTDNININFQANIKLAGTSQLIQTHTGTKQLTGTGKLFIDRESKSNIYRFSYFSSPVNSIGYTTYTLADVLKDGTIPTSATSSIVDINFIDGEDGSTSTPISIAKPWIYTYRSSPGSENNFTHKTPLEYIPQTDGFILKGTGTTNTSKQNFTYVGTPKDGEFTTSIGTNNFYLIGNPYPSAISVKKFIEDNTNAIDGTIYFWEHVGEDETGANGHYFGGYIGGYATRTIDVGVAADQYSANDTGANTPHVGDGVYQEPKPYIAVGQGFFVYGDSDGGTITFNNSQREHVTEGNNSIFFKTQKQKFLSKAIPIQETVINEKPIIKLGMDFENEDGQKIHRQIGVSFSPNTSFGYEPGYDAISFNDGDTDIAWKFTNDENKYVIAGVPEIDDNLEVPIQLELGYNGTVTIDIDEWQNIDREVYLLDKETNKTQSLTNGKATLTLAPQIYTDRFALVFKETEGLSVSEQEAKTIIITSSNKEIHVNNHGSLLIESIELYNLVGQQLESWNNINNQDEINLSPRNTPSSIYILQIKTDKGLLTRKVFIK